MRIVRLANFVTPRSGGLRTALHHLGAGYREAGHDPILIIPGATAADTETEQGRVITLPGPLVPGMGGYRLLVDRARVASVLNRLRPDRVEVSDRSTLRWVGRWCRRRDVPSMMVSHESLVGLLRLFGPAPSRRVADVLNARSAADHDQIVCTTAWAAAEFHRIGARNVTQVPLGVDLSRFSPGHADPALRTRWASERDVLLLHCGRLSPEKKPRRSLNALAALRNAGVPAVLLVAGAGPLRSTLQSEAFERNLPVRFLGHIKDPSQLAAILATVDITIAPGPIETFGLSALESLASGTPVVVSSESALPEVIGEAGLAAPGEGPSFARAITELLTRPEPDRRSAARSQAERFPWPSATAGFLQAHNIKTYGVPPPPTAPARPSTPARP